MTASLKLKNLESKISALKARQEHLLQQQAQAIAQMILRLDLGHVETTKLAGNLLTFKEKIKTNAPELEDWHRAGEKFLRKTKAKGKQAHQSQAHPNAAPADQSSL